MKLLGVDFEATGKDPKLARPIEAGFVLIDSETGETLDQYGDLIWREDYEPLSKKVQSITKITDNDIQRGGVAYEDVAKIFHEMAGKADYLVAHNVDYDRNLYGYESLRVGVEPNKYKWICTLKDVTWPDHLACNKLSHMALDLGLDMSKYKAHRASEDVRMMFDLVFHMGFEWKDIIEYYEKPKIIIQADVPNPFGDFGDKGVGKDQAKSLGYQWCTTWDNKLYDKQWTKKITQEEFDKETQALDYPVIQLTQL